MGRVLSSRLFGRKPLGCCSNDPYRDLGFLGWRYRSRDGLHGTVMNHEDRLFAELARIGKPRDRAMEAKYYRDPASHIKFAREQGGRMQRDIDATEAVLLKWADWMRRSDPQVSGYPSKASGNLIGSWIKDAEDEQEAADGYEMGKANAAVDSLVQAHQRMIYKRHNLGYTVWRFADEDALYTAAKVSFGRKYFSR